MSEREGVRKGGRAGGSEWVDEGVSCESKNRQTEQTARQKKKREGLGGEGGGVVARSLLEAG